jgi:hypothetical protein
MLRDDGARALECAFKARVTRLFDLLCRDADGAWEAFQHDFAAAVKAHDKAAIWIGVPADDLGLPDDEKVPASAEAVALTAAIGRMARSDGSR